MFPIKAVELDARLDGPESDYDAPQRQHCIASAVATGPPYITGKSPHQQNIET